VSSKIIKKEDGVLATNHTSNLLVIVIHIWVLIASYFMLHRHRFWQQDKLLCLLVLLQLFF